MEDDMWRADGSFRGIAGGRGEGKGKGKGGGAPHFNRVIPKFLQKYHQGPAEPGISTKFEAAPQPPGEEDGDGADELDDVQKAAMEEYLKKQEEKKKKKHVTDAGEEDAAATASKESEAKPPTGKQRVAAVGSGDAALKAKKRKTATKRKRDGEGKAVLSNKKLLSFSMDDEDA